MPEGTLIQPLRTWKMCVSLCRGFWSLEASYSLPGTVPGPLYRPVKKVHVCERGSESGAAYEKAKIPVGQMKALGVPQAGLPLEFKVSVTLEGVGRALWQRQQTGRVPLGFGSRRRKETEATHSAPSPWAGGNSFQRCAPRSSRQSLSGRNSTESVLTGDLSEPWPLTLRTGSGLRQGHWPRGSDRGWRISPCAVRAYDKTRGSPAGAQDRPHRPPHPGSEGTDAPWRSRN